jgi:hemolysin III
LFDLRNPVSAETHLFMACCAIFATLLMRRLTRGDNLRQTSVTVFGLSMIVLYSASGAYHGLRLPPEELRVFQQLDQSAIYLLIAGTYTPIMALLLTGRTRRWLLGGIWAMAAAGIACKWALPRGPHTLTVGIYLGMGWFGMLGFWHYYRAVGWRGMSWALGGAFLYTLGAVIELAKWPVLWPGVVQSHELLHICDMAATACHVVFVVRYVIVYRPAPALAPMALAA